MTSIGRAKLEKLKNLVRLAIEAEMAYMRLMGSGKPEVKVCHAIFKWPDVVNALLGTINVSDDICLSNINQAIIDTSIIVVNTIKPISRAYYEAIPSESKSSDMFDAIHKEPNINDPDDVVAWYKETTNAIKKMARIRFPEIFLGER